MDRVGQAFKHLLPSTLLESLIELEKIRQSLSTCSDFSRCHDRYLSQTWANKETSKIRTERLPEENRLHHGAPLEDQIAFYAMNTGT